MQRMKHLLSLQEFLKFCFAHFFAWVTLTYTQIIANNVSYKHHS